MLLVTSSLMQRDWQHCSFFSPRFFKAHTTFCSVASSELCNCILFLSNLGRTIGHVRVLFITSRDVWIPYCKKMHINNFYFFIPVTRPTTKRKREGNFFCWGFMISTHTERLSTRELWLESCYLWISIATPGIFFHVTVWMLLMFAASSAS